VLGHFRGMNVAANPARAWSVDGKRDAHSGISRALRAAAAPRAPAGFSLRRGSPRCMLPFAFYTARE